MYDEHYGEYANWYLGVRSQRTDTRLRGIYLINWSIKKILISEVITESENVCKPPPKMQPNWPKTTSGHKLNICM